VDVVVEIEDGRRLLVSDLGETAGPTILSYHGSGMGRTVYKPYLADAVQHGARVVSYDLPGLGGSTRRPGYSVADSADDVREIAAGLGIRRLTVWGTSAGGPFALACAALLPDLVAAVACLACGYLPPGVSEVGQGTDAMLALDPDAARAEYGRRAERERERGSSAAAMMEAYGEDLVPADAKAMSDGVAQWFADDVGDALALGGDGWFDEAWAESHDWGFDVADIQVPALLIHGRLDTWADPAISTWLAARIPGAELRLTPDDGHLGVLNHVTEATAWLLGYLG